MSEYDLEKRLQLFPLSAKIIKIDGVGCLTISGCDLRELAERYGTPLYLFDRLTMDEAVKNYQQSLSQHYPSAASITYAGKAFLCVAVAQWTQQHNLWVDCTGVGEISIASAAKVPKGNILVHGVSKSRGDLMASLEHAGTVVVDHLGELRTLASLMQPRSKSLLPNIWLRLRPGLAVDTHGYTQTGQQDSKFGFEPQEFLEAVAICRRLELPLNGVHFHLGSQFFDPSPIAQAIETALDLVLEAHSSLGWLPTYFCPGGGWGVAYHEDDLPHPKIEDYVRFISENLVESCQRRSLPLPHLQIEPGRSLIARAGVALYRVISTKKTQTVDWLLLNGGMADNPRPALYRTNYSALPVESPERPADASAWLAGPYCESGDILIQALAMPSVSPGELIAIPASGAYHLSMASNYNGACKPAVLWLDHNQASLIQRRESLEDLIRRDLPLPHR